MKIVMVIKVKDEEVEDLVSVLCDKITREKAEVLDVIIEHSKMEKNAYTEAINEVNNLTNTIKK